MHILPFDNVNKAIIDVNDSRVPLNYFNIVKLQQDQSFSYLNNDISERVAAELGESPKEESNSEKLVTNKMLYLVSSVTAGMVLIVASVFLLPFGSDLTSEELFAS